MAWAAALLCAACAAPVPPACLPEAAAGPVVWIVDYGWHTEIVIPADQASGPLDLFRRMFPAARTLSFGFGKTSFMTLPSPGLDDYVLGAIPGPATVRVIPLPAEPGRIYPEGVIRVPLDPAGWDSLAAFLWRAFAPGPNGAPIPVDKQDGTGGRFFQATSGYSLAYTCNAWSVDALQHAGLPLPGHVVLASGAMGETARIRGSCTPTPGS